MRVYIAGSDPSGAAELAAAFGDTGVEGARLIRCTEGRENLMLRLTVLSGCDAIWLPPGWQRDPRAVAEKAFADCERIPRVEYCLPRRERRC